MTSSTDLSFVGFVRQVLDALQAADVTYLVGGAMALWAWGEPRTTADLDLVIDLPIESMGALSLEIDRWVETLNLTDEWQEIQQRIAELRNKPS